MKNFSDTIWNRTRELPACSAVPPQTAPPRALLKTKNGDKLASQRPLETLVQSVIIIKIL